MIRRLVENGVASNRCPPDGVKGGRGIGGPRPRGRRSPATGRGGAAHGPGDAPAPAPAAVPAGPRVPAGPAPRGATVEEGAADIELVDLHGTGRSLRHLSVLFVQTKPQQLHTLVYEGIEKNSKNIYIVHSLEFQSDTALVRNQIEKVSEELIPGHRAPASRPPSLNTTCYKSVRKKIITFTNVHNSSSGHNSHDHQLLTGATYTRTQP